MTGVRVVAALALCLFLVGDWQETEAAAVIKADIARHPRTRLPCPYGYDVVYTIYGCWRCVLPPMLSCRNVRCASGTRCILVESFGVTKSLAPSPRCLPLDHKAHRKCITWPIRCSRWHFPIRNHCGCYSCWPFFVIIGIKVDGAAAAKEPECKVVCTKEYKPVCGTNGKTFGNLCEMESEACLKKTPIAVAHQGECGAERPELPVGQTGQTNATARPLVFPLRKQLK